METVYRNLLRNAGVDTYDQRAKLLDQNTVVVGKKKLTARTILIATGGRPFRPDILGIENALVSDDIFNLEKLPKSIAIIGGGYIACEMAKRYQELGVDIISTAVPRLFPLNENLMQSEGDEEIIKSLVHQSLNHPQIREIQSNFIPVIRGSEWSKDTVISIEKGLKKAGHKIIFFQGTQSILN